MKVVKEDHLWNSKKSGISTKIVFPRRKIVKQVVQ